MDRTNQMVAIEKTSLLQALTSLSGKTVIDAAYEIEKLQGGSLGEVCCVSAEAVTESGRQHYKLVIKTQRKWERHGDPDCWRREHDLYKADIFIDFSNQVKLPRCLLLEEEVGLTRIWMEYVEGAAGKQLHADELALAAERLGSFQADFHLRGRTGLSLLRSYPAVRSSFDLWWKRVAGPLCENIDGFPEELRLILNRYSEQADELLNSFDALPVTLCQGDVHQDNLILREERNGTSVYLIDWDSAGYGRMGEDAVDVLIEAFVYSDRDVSLMPDFRRRIMDGYCQGAKLQGVDFEMKELLVRDIFALAWGYRIADIYLNGKDEYSKQRCVEILNVMLT
jgi:hypothetical protein